MKVLRIPQALLAWSALSVPGFAQDKSQDNPNLFNLSLKELLSVKFTVPAALTKLTVLESPAAITVITAEDIRITPARNLYDLLEVYVPGAYWMTSETGPKLGVRGIISSRNYKYLLLVNGQEMNEKATVGASSELEMWDLADIERIEIVSGPGSVTYGPGAVAGVISITTRKPGSGHDTTVSAGYVGPYRSKSWTFSRQIETASFNTFIHASVVRTEGQAAHAFQVANNNTLGFVGEDFRPTAKPLDYYADYQDRPQVKLHAELEFANDWQWWTRYTQQGSDWFSNEVKSNFGGQLLNQQGLRSRQITTAVQHGLPLSDKISLKTTVSLGSYDFERRQENVYNPDPGNALNYRVNYAQDQFTVRGTLNWEATGWAQIAVGAQWDRDHYGPGWGDDPQQMRLGESGEIINGPDSQGLSAGSGNDANRLAPAWPAIYVGNGWSETTRSLFTEANLAFSSTQKLLLSGRADKNTFTHWMWSPRVAWISTLADGQVLKIMAQRSSRMNTASQLFANAQHGIDNQPERLNATELRYSAQLGEALKLDASAYHNNLEVVVFQGIDNTNRLVGNLKLNGLEADLRYAMARGHIGAGLSSVKQQSWKMAQGVNSNNVSYSDYNLIIGGTGGHTQQGVGNDLNNWPNRSLKLFGDCKIGNKLTMHVDVRWYSVLQGAKDGLIALRQAVEGTAAATPAFYSALDQIAAEHVYDSETRLNVLFDFAYSPHGNVELYGQNLFGRNGNKRYGFDEASNTNAAPRRVRFVEEPTTWGIRLVHRF